MAAVVTRSCKSARKMVYCRDYAKLKKAAQRRHRRYINMRCSLLLKQGVNKYTDFNHMPCSTHRLTSWQIA